MTQFYNRLIRFSFLCLILTLTLLYRNTISDNYANSSYLSFVNIWSCISIFVLVVSIRLDYLNPLLAFLCPWLLIIYFSSLPMSEYARPLREETYLTLFAMLSSAICSYYFFIIRKPIVPKKSVVLYDTKGNRYRWAIAIFVLFTVFNVVAAGYIPLFNVIKGMDTGYLDFGIHGIYGFYNAFVNALGVLSFFLYLTTSRRRYLSIYLAIILVFILLMTRQNLISLMVESLVTYSFVRGKISLKKIGLFLLIALFLFSLVGQLRSGDIKTLAHVTENYKQVPDAIIWVYTYCYFNVLNLDNLIHNPNIPLYDGSSFFALFPSFLRPANTDIGNILEVPLFNVSSYMTPVYADGGLAGVILFTILVTWWSIRAYRRAYHEGSFYSVAAFSTLLFCALFSFFVNFWFYLPVIFQIPIFKIFSKFVIRTSSMPVIKARRRSTGIAKAIAVPFIIIMILFTPYRPKD